MNDKVFCFDCKHFRDVTLLIDRLFHNDSQFQVEDRTKYECLADPHYLNTPLEQFVVYGDPRKINQDNDCPKFEKKFRIRDLFRRK